MSNQEWFACFRLPNGTTKFYACIESTVDSPGWTPYAACAQEYYDQKQAEMVAESALRRWCDDPDKGQFWAEKYE